MYNRRDDIKRKGIHSLQVITLAYLNDSKSADLQFLTVFPTLSLLPIGS